MKKDVIYIDIEDDITAIIDKVKDSKAKIIALVPPKRSTVLNSAVNMKLLLKSAEQSSKRVVLVTSEPSLLSLAGGVGLLVTANLHSKPAVPKVEELDLGDNAVIEGAELDPSSTIGELDELGKATKSAKTGEKPDKADKTKAIKSNKFKIPNFEAFRGKLFLIIAGLILLAGGWWWAFFVAPTASVAIKAQTSSVPVNFEITANTQTEETDFETNNFATEKIEIKKTVSESFTPTGKKNVGDKASGSMTIQNCDNSEGFTLAGGTIFTSPSGLKFEGLESADVPGGTFSGGGCSSPGEATINVRAVAPGKDYNLPEGTIYDIDTVGSLVVGYGGAMSGGTDKTVTVVAQKDISEATKKLKEQNQDSVLSELLDQIPADKVAINETYNSKMGDVSTQPAAGSEANSATVSSSVTYSLLVLNRDDLTKAVEESVNASIEGGDQSIYNNGMDELQFTLIDKKSVNNYALELNTLAFIGPDLDIIGLAQEVSGKRYSEVLNIVEQKPGVVEVDVNFAPFWVFSAPSPDKIDIQLNINEQET